MPIEYKGIMCYETGVNCIVIDGTNYKPTNKHENKMTENQNKINIDGKEYLVADLSDEAKAQIQSLQFVNNEIARLNAKLAVSTTARNAYTAQLKEILDNKE